MLNNKTKSIEKTYKAPYGTIHYWITYVNAENSWIILLPGLTADHHLFDKQVEGFKEKYNCLTWDAPAHGLSRPFQLKFSMGDIAQYLHDILEKEGIVNPTLIDEFVCSTEKIKKSKAFPKSNME